LSSRATHGHHPRKYLFDEIEIGPARLDCWRLRAEHRTLCDDDFDSLLDCTDDDNLAAGIAVPPQGDSLGIDSVQSLGEVHRITVASALNPGIDLLPWLAAAPSEVPVVVEQDRQAGTRKRLRIFVRHHVHRG
jgi:hypothetical protein